MNRDPYSRPRNRALSPEQVSARRAAMARRAAEQRRTVHGLLIANGVAAVLLVALLVTGAMNKNGEERPPIGETNAQTTDALSEETGKPVIGQTDALTTEKPNTELPEIGTVVPDVTFKADLSAFERYMNPTGSERDAYLLLVNPQNPLGAEDDPVDLIEVSATRQDGRNPQKMRETAAKALEAMFIEADSLGHINNSTGYALSVTSAFRSYSYQEYLFNSYVEQEMAADPSLSRAQAEAIVEQYSCRAGMSEHQSGLCADLHNQASASSSHPEHFANTPEGKWITENCWKFGFVLRFPADKTEVTGIKYESWHFRYVGRYHAYRMTEMGLCLEEYVQYLQNEQG